jgi:Xaa-Pro aminopeptidase
MFDKKILSHIKSDSAYLISNPINSSYLSGFSGSVSHILLTGKKIYLFTDARYLHEIKASVGKNFIIVDTGSSFIARLAKIIKNDRLKKIHFESDNLSYQRYSVYKKEFKNIKLVPSENFVEKIREVKNPREINNLIKAQRIAEKVLNHIIKNLKAGQTEKEISWQIVSLGQKFGADTISFEPIVAINNSSGTPHHQNTDRKLKKGDMILLDFGFKYKGYCSDMTRMLFTKNPTPLQQKIYNIVLLAQEKAISQVTKGSSTLKIDKTAREIIGKAGYGKNFTHSLGHGVGLEIHETPHVSNKVGNTLENNNVITIEPGIYLQNSFGIRIEDMLLVKGNKAVNITLAPKRLKDCIISIK